MKRAIILLFILLVVFSCEKNEEDENTLQGKWNVTKIIGGFRAPVDYNIGELTWFIDLSKNEVIIENNKDHFPALHIPTFSNNQGGTYTFQIIKENNLEYFIVGNRKGIIKLENNELIIDYGIAHDDIAYIFKQ